jgi:crossover junction endodeoxyribonuclease RuvC
MVVVGFDPGSICFGVGILRRENRLIRYVYSEEIKMSPIQFYDRMTQLWDRLKTIFSDFEVDSVAIEEGYMGKNVRSMNLLAQVRGLAMGFVIERNIGLAFYSPRQVKLAVTGSGKAMKSQISKSMKLLLQLPDKNFGSDESDALAVAYCHMLSVK